MGLPEIEPMVPKKSPDPRRSLHLFNEELLKYCQDPNYAMELKWDGFRCLICYDDGKIVLRTKEKRTHKVFKGLADPLVDIFKEAEITNIILDSEIVCLDNSGKPGFANLWHRANALNFYTFDLLFHNGQDLRTAHYLERKQKLVNTLFYLSVCSRTPSPLLYSQHILDAQIKTQSFIQVLNKDMEGGVFKHVDSTYGDLDLPWVKFRNPGYTQDQDRRRLFRRINNSKR